MERFQSETVYVFIWAVGLYWTVTGAIDLRDYVSWGSDWWFAGFKLGAGAIVMRWCIEKKVMGRW